MLLDKVTIKLGNCIKNGAVMIAFTRVGATPFHMPDYFIAFIAFNVTDTHQ
jgi:hypothetical protein